MYNISTHLSVFIKFEESESVNRRRRTDSTMAKRKRQTTQWPKEKDRQHNSQKKKEQTTIYKTPHLKIRIEQNELFYLKTKNTDR